MMQARAVPLGQSELDDFDADLEDLVGYNLKRAYVIISTDFRRVLGQDGFSPRVFSAMSLITQCPNITQSELARRLGIERSGLVAIIDELERRGFVERRSVPSDRRVQALAPTKSGNAAYIEARTEIRAHEADLLSGLTSDERETLMRLLRKIRKIEE